MVIINAILRTHIIIMSSRTHKNEPPGSTTTFRYREFNRKRTKSHRVHSLHSDADKKMFAQEYAKITSDFKNILGSRRNRLKMTSEMKNPSKSTSKGHSFGSAEKVSLRKRENEAEQFSTNIMKKTNTKTNFNHTQSLSLNSLGNANPDLFVHLQVEKDKKINPDFPYVKELVAHFENLYRIREDLDDIRNNYENIIRSVKKYVFNQNGADICRLDSLLRIEGEKKRLRAFLCLEKVVVIGVMDSLVRECENSIENEGKYALDTIIGVYYSILSFVSEEKMALNSRSRILALLKLLDELEYQKRKDLVSTNDFLFKKMAGLFRFNQSLMEKVRESLIEAKQQEYKVNKFFYRFLAEYARNLNQSQLLNWNRNLLDSFATCPSPHLPFSRVKGNLTLVLQFEGVLGFVKTANKKNVVRLRPFATEMVANLKKIYEVVIFTCLMPEQFSEACELFQSANAVLFKYHAVRYRGTLVKDLSRLGRKAEEVILLDDQPGRNMMSINKQNTLIVDTWRGSQHDQELTHANDILGNIASLDPKDVRDSISHYQLKVEQRRNQLNRISQLRSQEDQEQEEGEGPIKKDSLNIETQIFEKIKLKEKVEKGMERVEKVEKGMERAEKGEKVERVKKVDKVEKIDKGEKVEKMEQPSEGRKQSKVQIQTGDD